MRWLSFHGTESPGERLRVETASRIDHSRKNQPPPDVDDLRVAVVAIDELTHQSEIDDALSLDRDQSAGDRRLRGPVGDEVGVIDDHEPKTPFARSARRVCLVHPEALGQNRFRMLTQDRRWKVLPTSAIGASDLDRISRQRKPSELGMIDLDAHLPRSNLRVREDFADVPYPTDGNARLFEERHPFAGGARCEHPIQKTLELVVMRDSIHVDVVARVGESRHFPRRERSASTDCRFRLPRLRGRRRSRRSRMARAMNAGSRVAEASRPSSGTLAPDSRGSRRRCRRGRRR